MKLSTQSRYGVRAIFDIAYNSEGLETQVKDISRRQEYLPPLFGTDFSETEKSRYRREQKGTIRRLFLE